MEPDGPGREALGREEGRSDARNLLRVRLPEAPADYVDGALDNPEVGPEEVALLLRNPRASTATLARIGRDRSLLRERAVRSAFVRHARSPLAIARTQLPHLFWKDLATIAADVRLSPILRRDAERLVRVRLPELTLGEKIALARRASRGLIAALAEEPEAPVLRALAGNGRTTESDVVRMATRSDAPRDFLSWIVGQSRWGVRRAVRLAVVRHPRTPPAAALSAIAGLSLPDLDALRRDQDVPTLVQVAVERRRSTPPGSARDARPDHG